MQLLLRGLVLTVVFIFASGCSNQPPSAPIVFGPQRGRPVDTLVFSAVAVDKEGDSLQYFFEGNGGLVSGWSDWYPSGVEYYQEMVFVDTGNYFLRVKARDARQESGWSDTLMVTIKFYTPLVPRRPAGPDTVLVQDTVAFFSSVQHPLGESVALQFDWGDGYGEWGSFVIPGAIVYDRHVYLTPGLYEVRCRAKDRKGFISDWSLPETVLVVDSIFF